MKQETNDGLEVMCALGIEIEPNSCKGIYIGEVDGVFSLCPADGSLGYIQIFEDTDLFGISDNMSTGIYTQMTGWLAADNSGSDIIQFRIYNMNCPTGFEQTDYIPQSEFNNLPRRYVNL